jgi:hypothetical protein
VAIINGLLTCSYFVRSLPAIPIFTAMKRIEFCILAVLLLCSCNKYTGGVMPNNTLSAIELKLIGTWNLRKEADTVLVNGSVDTALTKIYSSFASSLYVTFASGNYSTTSAGNPSLKYMDDGAALSRGFTSGYDRSTLSIPVKPSSWYYDTTGSHIRLKEASSRLISVTDEWLILRTTATDSTAVTTQTLYFEK